MEFRFLDAELPKYYRDLLNEMHSGAPKSYLEDVVYELQEAKVKAMEELTLAKSTLTVYDRFIFVLLGIVVCLLVVICVLVTK